jgi:hypothetical protein
MKLANLSKVGESFLSENFEEVEELEEDKHFGGTKDQKMSPAKAAKAPKKVMKEADEEEGMGAEEPEMDMGMPEAPEVEPAEEPTDMSAEDLTQKIVDLLQGAGLIDVVDEEEGGEEEDMDMGGEEEEVEEEVEMEDESSYEETMYESKRRIAKVVAERVMARIQKEEKVERLSETITKRVMERLSRG